MAHHATGTIPGAVARGLPSEITSITFTTIETDEKNEFIRRPKWRTRTTPARRRIIAAVTFAVIVVFGLVIVVAVSFGLRALGAPDWLVAAPLWAPVAGTVIWTLRSPAPAELSDDDDESWSGYAIRAVMVGDLVRRPVAVRVLAAVVFGAPIVWSFVVLTALELSGIF